MIFAAISPRQPSSFNSSLNCSALLTASFAMSGSVRSATNTLRAARFRRAAHRAAACVDIAEVDLFVAAAVQHDLLGLGRQVLPRLFDVELVVLGERLHEGEVIGRAA